MAQAQSKIILSSSRNIPFNQLLLSQSNVRRIKAGVSIEELAEDIARRTLLQSITVRAVCDAEGVQTGMFEIPAGGRRYRALELLVKQKRLAKTAPIPCVVREGGIAEEDSLAENLQRAPLHPLDQFRAFLTLREKGQSEEEIAAAFFVSVAVVKQRLRLASVSPKLLDIYAADGMTLDQLMAFTVNGDHGRQEAVFERLSASYDKQPYTIRRMLTEGAVRASDKRAQFIGVEAYAQASGVILNDLFQGDDGGWLQDVALVEMMVAQKLQDEGGKIQAEGWKWIEVAPDFPYGHTYGLRQLLGRTDPLTDEEAAARAALQGEVDLIEETYAQAEELPDEADQRLGELEAALAAFDERPVSFEPDDVGRAGAFVSIAPDGSLRVERGYLRPEDEQPITPSSEEYSGEDAASQSLTAQTEDVGGAVDSQAAIEPDEEDGLKPLSERLMTELTSYRTLGLRHALGEQPDVAFLAAVHALALRVFYIYGSDSCLELDLKSVQFGSQAPGLHDSAAAIAIATRHQSWRDALPRDSEALWDALQDFDSDSRQALFAHCVAQGVNAVHETWNRRPRAIAHADRLAQAVDLDMVAEGWTPTIDSYLGRVTKARLLQALAEVKGQRAADRIEHLKKGEMAEQAAVLLAGSGWLAEPLRNPGRAPDAAFNENEADPPEIAAVKERSAADGGESAMEEEDASVEDEGVASGPHAIAAE